MAAEDLAEISRTAETIRPPRGTGSALERGGGRIPFAQESSKVQRLTPGDALHTQALSILDTYFCSTIYSTNCKPHGWLFPVKQVWTLPRR